MIGRKKFEEYYIIIVEVKEFFERRYVEGFVENFEELMFYEVRVSFEYVECFVKLKFEQVREFKEKFMGFFDWINERIVVKFVDILLEDYFDICVIFVKEEYMLIFEEVEEIIKVIDEYWFFD